MNRKNALKPCTPMSLDGYYFWVQIPSSTALIYYTQVKENVGKTLYNGERRKIGKGLYG
jgi:hypothetical protein